MSIPISAVLSVPADAPPVAKFVERPCPACGKIIPYYEEFSPWCECGWNLAPPKPELPPSTFETIYERAGRHLGEGLFAELANAASLRPHWTISRVLAYLLACAVEALTLLLAFTGIWLALAARFNLAIWFVAILCMLVAWALRPRFGKVGKYQQVLSRVDFPSLYRLTDRVAKLLQMEPINAIVVDQWFNASFGRVGWRQKRVMWLGLPLWAVLSDQERVDLVAHELAHAVNGDANRSMVIGTAINSLIVWYQLLMPQAIWPHYSGLQGLIGIPFRLLMWGLARVVWLLAYTLVHLLYRDKQRAEYLADSLAGNVAGTSAGVSGLEKLQMEGTFRQTVQRMALQGKDDENFFAAFRSQLAIVPERERERMRRVSRLESSRLNFTHPPTAKRIEMLQLHPVADPKLTISPSESAALAAEMDTLAKQVQLKLFDGFRRRLYR